jgi:HEAT repeat protein
MYKSPDLPMPDIVRVFPEGALDRWRKALERSEVDIRCEAAEAVARACRRGVKGLEVTVPLLCAVIDREDEQVSVQRAAAQALITLDARETAPSLLRLAQACGANVRDLVEPALARWDYKPARAVWLERLQDPSEALPGLLLAARGLAMVGEVKAAQRLREMMLAEHSHEPVRLEAARALGTLRHEGLEKDAEALGADLTPRGTASRLAAAALLRRHGSQEAVRLLQRLAQDTEPTVAEQALARLLEIDPKLVVPALEQVLVSPDPKVRSWGVEVLFRLPTEAHLRLLADRLDDQHLDVRRKARRYLRELADKKEFHTQIIADARRLLAMANWQGLEQAIILLAQLDYKPATNSLAKLLQHNRPEVYISAAWAFRKLDVPETLPFVATYVGVTQARLQNPPKGQAAPDVLSVWLRGHQLSQLNQFLGQRRYAPAEPALRNFVPRPSADPEARAAAIWALGLIHEGRTDSALVTALLGRLNDVRSAPIEDERVRQMCAITVARMKVKDKETLANLRRYCPDLKPVRDFVHNACGWAIAQLTGEVVPPPQAIRSAQIDWFLTADR